MRAMHRLAVAISALVSLLVLAVAGRAHAAPLTLAVSYFDNNSGDTTLDPLARGLADMLITDLGQIGSLQIVERAKLNDVMKELDLSRSKFIDPKTALKLGKGLAAAYILSGSYLIAGETMRIDVRIFEVASGKVMAGEKVEGPKGDFFALEKDLVDILVRAVGVKLESKERSALRRNATESFDAFQAYSRGLTFRDAGDDDKARAEFQAALDADPGYQAARDAMGRLKAIFRIDDSNKASAYDAALKAVVASDPKAKDFAQKVAQLFQMASGADRDSIRHRVELLLWLQGKNLEPALPPFSPVPFNALTFAYRMQDDPSMEETVIATCEYFIGRYPSEDYPKTYCRGIVQSIEGNRKGSSVAERQKDFDDEVAGDLKNVSDDDWRRALHESSPAIRKMLKGYAARARR